MTSKQLLPLQRQIQQIIQQDFQCSSLSNDVSFTISDILKQPIDQQLILNIDQDQMSGVFQDDDQMFQDQQKQQQQQQQQEQEQLDNLKKSDVQQYNNNINDDDDFNSNQKRDKSQGKIKNLGKTQSQIQRRSQGYLYDNNKNTYNNNLSPLRKGKKHRNHNKQKSQKSIQKSKSKLNNKSQLKSSLYGNNQKPHIVRRYARLQDMNLIPLQEIQNMTYIALKNVTALFNDQNKNQRIQSLPTCISTTGDKFLAIGTTNSTIVVFQVGVKGQKTLKGFDQRGKPYGSVLSVSISHDNKYLVAGHQSGLISIWDLYYFSLSKVQLMAGKAKVIKVLFCCQDSSYFVANDSQGNVIMYTIEKMFWLNVKQQKLIEKTQNVYYDIKYSTLLSGREILALCCLDYVLILSTRPTMGVMHKISRPQGVNKLKIPNTQLGRCSFFFFEQKSNSRQSSKQMQIKQLKSRKKEHQKDIICISWGKVIYIYKFFKIQYEQFQQIQLLHIFNHETTLHNLEFITNQILITLDQHQTLRALNITSLLKKQKSDLMNKALLNNNNNNNQIVLNSQQKSKQTVIINTTELNEEIIYQRQIKDLHQKYIRSFSNTMSNCNYSKSQKQVFFITKDSVFRGRIHKWPQYVHGLLKQQREWLKGLKICLELHDGNLDIFAQRLNFNQKTKSIFCQIGSIFLQKEIKNLFQKKGNKVVIGMIRQEIQQIFQITIQFFIKLKAYDYLFSQILELIHKKCPTDDYQQFFVDCLQPFIIQPTVINPITFQQQQQSMIKHIPNQKAFRFVIKRFVELNKISIIDKLIMGLDHKSVFISQVVQVCTQNKLYRSLAHVCSIHLDFISPMNKILTAWIQAKRSKLTNAQLQNKNIFKEYLTCILQMKYITKKQIPYEIYQPLMRQLEVFLLCQQYYKFFVLESQADDDSQQNIFCTSSGGSDQDSILVWYFDILMFNLAKGLLKTDQDQYIHSMLRKLIQYSNLNNFSISKSNNNNNSKEQKYQRIKQKISKLIIQIGVLTNVWDECIQFAIKNHPSLRIFQKQRFYGETPSCIGYYPQIQAQAPQISLLTCLKFQNKYQQKLKFLSKQQEKQKDCLNYFKYVVLQGKLEFQAMYYLFICLQFPYQQFKKKILSLSPQNEKILAQIQLLKRQQKYHFEYIQKFKPKSKSTNIQTLVQYILQTINTKKIDSIMSDLLKMSSQQTMAYIIQSYNSSQINQKLREINPIQQRYIAIRKILKIIRHHHSNNKKNDHNHNIKNIQMKIINKKQKQLQNLTNELKIKQSKSVDKDKSCLSLQLNSKIITLQQDLIQFYLECLCQLKKQRRIYAQLKQNAKFFETQNCLIIVQKYKLISCIAYLKKIQKNYKQAYINYQIVYNKYFQENYRKLQRFIHCDGRFMGRIFYQMINVLQQQQGSNWLKLLKSVLSPFEQRGVANKIQQIYQQKLKQINSSKGININKNYISMASLLKQQKQHPFILKLLQILQRTLTQVSRHTTVQQMTKQVSSHTGLLQNSFIINSLSSTLNSFSRNILIYTLTNQMVVADHVKQFQYFYDTFKVKGITSQNNFCQKCFKPGFLLQSNVNLIGTINQSVINYSLQMLKINERKQKYKQRNQYQNQDQDDRQIRQTQVVIKQNKNENNKNNKENILSYLKKLKIYPCGHVYHQKPCDIGKCLQCAKKQLGQYKQLSQLQKYKIHQQNNKYLINTSILKQQQLSQDTKIQNQDVYRALAFDDYINTQFQDFQAFRNKYQEYISKQL